MTKHSHISFDFGLHIRIATGTNLISSSYLQPRQRRTVHVAMCSNVTQESMSKLVSKCTCAHDPTCEAPKIAHSKTYYDLFADHQFMFFSCTSYDEQHNFFSLCTKSLTNFLICSRRKSFPNFFWFVFLFSYI
jgi:Mg2+ and Co2+ transporter CorA